MSAIEDQVCAKIQLRASFGVEKYGISLERTDLSVLDWLIHAQEETMDSANYLQVLINKEKLRWQWGVLWLLTLRRSEPIKWRKRSLIRC
jgi:hypothetical protein